MQIFKGQCLYRLRASSTVCTRFLMYYTVHRTVNTASTGTVSARFCADLRVVHLIQYKYIAYRMKDTSEWKALVFITKPSHIFEAYD